MKNVDPWKCKAYAEMEMVEVEYPNVVGVKIEERSGGTVVNIRKGSKDFDAFQSDDWKEVYMYVIGLRDGYELRAYETWNCD